MKTLFKLIVVASVLHAVGQAGMVAWDYYQLKDATQQLITFGSQVPTGRIHNQILEMAWEKELPLSSQDVVVDRQGIRTTATARYTQQYEYFSNNFYPVELDFSVDAYSIAPGVQDEDSASR
jgi:hypothetical protein